MALLELPVSTLGALAYAGSAPLVGCDCGGPPRRALRAGWLEHPAPV
ncbi:hypothetical protein [Haloterrigena salina]|nr:hypothetical protein [Haloterrigena salina]